MPLRRRLILLFVLLLVLSHAWRWWRLPATGPAKPGQQIAVVPEFDAGDPTGKSISFAYREFPSAGNLDDAPCVVLLHGSPGSSSQVEGIARLLGGEYRVILPDLPGFGASTRNLPDYSIEAHAHYLLALLDELHIEKAHLLGFSLGGGVIIHSAALAPDRVASLTLLASIGVQELELLGDHMLNHGLHGLQLIGIWLVQHGFPHFGFMDDAMFNLAYARNFFDTDQRPLRAVLEQIQSPVLIVHGKHDSLVPYSAALEHHRILPQSELVTLDRNHFVSFVTPGLVADPVSHFIRRVEKGEAPARASAAPDRTALAAEPFDWKRQAKAISTPLFMLFLALATLITEDLTCISAGILASKGVLPFWTATLACILGIVLGDSLLYLAGRALGKGALTKKPFRWFINESQVEQSAHFFHQYGMSLIFITRFIPGTRLPTYFAAGVLGTSFWKFTVYFVLAAVAWTPLLVGIAYFVGGRMLNWFQQYESYSLLGLLSVFVVMWLVIKLVFPLFSWRGRRLLLGGWRRKTRWEFWPPLVFYPPIVLYILYLGARHRCFTLFTATNPAIPAGGFTMESKHRILQGFGDAPEIAAFEFIPKELDPAKKLWTLTRFLETNQLAFPLVLKPDVGERGQGVAIVRNQSEAETYLARCPHDVIAQEFVPGEEFGLFYYRHPNEKNGHLFSITDKRMVAVTGDGHSTLEELILKDDRAVCLAPRFLDQWAAHLDNIPAAGESFPLTELGTHCRGALFLDGNELLSPELESTIDTLSKQFDGFYFGRYDVRATSRDALRAGKGFKVLELNGVTSESTDIYDPANSLFAAYRKLAAQWRIAFQIGAANAEYGRQPLSPARFLRLIQRFHNKEKFEA